MASPQVFHFVEFQSIHDRLDKTETPSETVEEFYRFGTLLFSEIQQRGAEVDRKLITALGWSIATLALLLNNQSLFTQAWSYAKVAAIGAGLLSAGCAAIAAYAAKTRLWDAPSESDWFQKDLWNTPEKMKQYHILSMLATHQAQSKNVKIKSACLGFIEIFLAISGLAIFSVLLSPLFS